MLPAYPSEASRFQPAAPPYPPFPDYRAPGQAGAQQGTQGQNYPPAPSYQGYAGSGANYGGSRAYPQNPGHPGNPGYQSYPGYQPYPPMNGYAAPGYYPYAYAPYPYAYGWQPPKPKRDGYLFGIGIAAFVCSILTVLVGLGCLFLLGLLFVVPNASVQFSSFFASAMFFGALAAIGIIGGGFGIYHSVRSAFLKKPSRAFALPWFWLFLLLYLGVLGIGFLLHAQGKDTTWLGLTIPLILLAGIFPALTILALGVRRLHWRHRDPKAAYWPTTWRRAVLALISGGTLSIGIAILLEFVLEILVLRTQSFNPLTCVNQPNLPGCQNPSAYNVILILVALIAPIVEETVKPLAVILLIGRVRSAAEAFALGLLCGIGFDLIETTGYISTGYNDWLNVAVIRSGAGLLHGFGAGMVALGWYIATHPEKGRVARGILLGSACWLYAVLQHAFWNGSFGLTLLPAPIGPFFANSNLSLGPISLAGYEVVNVIEMILMLAFFVWITGRIRKKSPPPEETLKQKTDVGAMQQPQMALR